MKRPERVEPNRKHSQNPVQRILRPIVLGTLAGAVICAVLLLVLSLILVAVEQLPQSLLQPVTMLIAALGTFFAGYTAAHMSGECGMLHGAGSVLLLLGLLSLAGLTASGESVSVFMLTKGLIMVLTGAITGILSANKKSRRKQAFQVSILVL